MARNEIFPVTATRDAAGKLVAVAPSSKIEQGFQFAGQVYASRADAQRALNLSNAKIAVEDAADRLTEALYSILWYADPVYGDWAKQEAAQEETRELAARISRTLLPTFGNRDVDADTLFDAMARAQLAWKHLRKVSS